MDEERTNEIERHFLLQDGISPEECRELELQELIYLFHSAKVFIEKDSFQGSNFDEKLKVFYSIVIEKIKNAEELFLAYDPNTNYPYIDEEDRIWMFTKEMYALSAKDFFLQQLLQLEMRKISGKEIIRTFTELHILGLRKIIVDNGQYHIEVDRNDILPPQDWGDVPEIEIPTVNPNLQHALIQYTQSLYSKSNYEGKEQLQETLGVNLLDEIIQARYLAPMQMKKIEPSIPDEQGMITLKEGTTILLANLEDEDQKTWLPVFTDWIEFEKAYDKTVWSGMILPYDDLMAWSKRVDGIIVNCKGVSFRIDDSNKKMFQDYKQKKIESQHAVFTTGVIQGKTRVKIGNPREYPEKMIEAVIRYMKNQRDIKKAYLKLMKRDNVISYLIIVDFESDFKDKRVNLFEGIAKAAAPHMSGILNLIEMGDSDDLNESQPFYRKKRFGLF